MAARSPIFANCGTDDILGMLGARYYGGAASSSSVQAAAVLGGSLWLAASVAAWRLRRKLGLLFGGYAALYVVELVVLWEVSPLIWGPRHC